MDIKKFLMGFIHALRGIRQVAATQRNMQVHLLAVVLVSAAGLFFGISATEWMLVSLAFGLVISAEIINTAIEQICDRVSPEFDPFIKNAKDMAAGAVLFNALIALIIAIFIFGPKLMHFTCGS